MSESENGFMSDPGPSKWSQDTAETASDNQLGLNGHRFVDLSLGKEGEEVLRDEEVRRLLIGCSRRHE